jgi:type I restriction enzyme S subunit
MTSDEPRRRFPGFSGPWVPVAVREAFGFLTTVALSREALAEDGEIRNIHYGDIHMRLPKFVDPETSDLPAIRDRAAVVRADTLSVGDVIVADAAEDREGVGKAIELVGSVPTPTTAGLHTLALRPLDERFAPGFAAVALSASSARRQVERLATGVAVFGISKSSLESVVLRVPEYAEQVRVAGLFEALEETRILSRRMITQLTRYKRTVARRVFSGELRFSPATGEDFPEWDTVPLSHCASRLTSRNRDHAVLDVLTNSAAHGVTRQRDFFEKDIAVQGNLANYLIVPEGAFVYNPRISALAPVGPIRRNRVGLGVMSPLYTVFGAYGSNPDYLEQYFLSDLWNEYILSVANQGARSDRMSISIADFMGMPIPLPSPAEQELIAGVLGAVDETIAAERRRIELLTMIDGALIREVLV